jgi:hypothetical protein
LAIDILISAVPALQVIGIVAAKEPLIINPARDQRVIPSFAIEFLIIAVPALQAIGIIVAIKFLIIAPARD